MDIGIDQEVRRSNKKMQIKEEAQLRLGLKLEEAKKKKEMKYERVGERHVGLARTSELGLGKNMCWAYA